MLVDLESKTDSHHGRLSQAQDALSILVSLIVSPSGPGRFLRLAEERTPIEKPLNSCQNIFFDLQYRYENN